MIPLGNVSAGNGRNGIEVAGTASGFTTFNTFGGLLAFKGAAPNGRDGLLITSTGGDNLVRTNVFSGNRGNGIELGGNASGVTVDPDIAGLNTNGNGPLPNGGDGLRIDGTAHGNIDRRLAALGDPAEHVLRERRVWRGHLRPGAQQPGVQQRRRHQRDRDVGAGQPEGRRPAHRGARTPTSSAPSGCGRPT